MFSLISLITLLSFSVKPNVMFFSGGNSLMPDLIYGNFIEKLAEISTVKCIKNSLDNVNTDSILNQLLENGATKDNSIAISHSSGATTLLNHCSNFDMEKIILLDPVDNNDFLWKKTPTPFKNYNDVLVIKAEKSYQWSFDKLKKHMMMIPSINIPFIPLGKLDTSKISNRTEITLKDFGHCDILDQPYNNYMHNSFSKGNENRDLIPLYRKKIVEIINLYLDNNINEETLNSTLCDYGINFSIEKY